MANYGVLARKEYMGCVTGKVPNALSPCHTKRRTGRGWSRLSFFWYDTDFLDVL